MMDLLQILQTCSFCLLQMLTDGLERCGLLWCFYQLFGLSFWRHPFTADTDAETHFSKSDEETNKLIYISDGLRVSKLSAYFHFWVNCSFNVSAECTMHISQSITIINSVVWFLILIHNCWKVLYYEIFSLFCFFQILLCSHWWSFSFYTIIVLYCVFK